MTMDLAQLRLKSVKTHLAIQQISEIENVVPAVMYIRNMFSVDIIDEKEVTI